MNIGVIRHLSLRMYRRLFPASLPPRLLIIFFAIIVQTGAEVLSWYAINSRNPAIISFAVLLWLVWFWLVYLIARPSIDRLLNRRRKVLQIAVLCIIVVLFCMSIGEAIGFHLVNTGVVEENEMAEFLTENISYNDATALNHQASLLLLEGENPYENTNIVQAVEKFDVPAGYLTPLKQGAFAEVFPYPTEEQVAEVLEDARASDALPPELESKVSYPAGSFIFQAPLVALGLEDTRWFYLICAVLMVLVILWKAPGELRPIIFLAFITNLVFWNLIGTGTTDTLYVLFILLGWIFRRRIWLAALFMGLAATTKQIAWLFILFYIVLLLKESGWRKTLQSVGIIGATFTLINLPFIFAAPQAWLEGVLAPVLDPMFPKGVGLVAFSIAGILPPNSLLFTITEIIVLLLALVWYYFNCRKYPESGLLLAVLPLFFAWRSFSCYFYFASLLVFGAAAIAERGKGVAGAQPRLAAAQ